MAESTRDMPDLSERPDREVVLKERQLRLLLAAFEAAGAHEPDDCSGECPAPLEHDAVVLLHEMLER